jgi:hypothetical protein
MGVIRMISSAIRGFRRALCSAGVPAVLTVLAAAPLGAHAGCSITIGVAEAAALADKIWRNESGRDADKILWWNRGEEFASLGIGHFIWYPPGREGPFQESFPRLLEFLSERGAKLPAWLDTVPPPACPWLDREQFLAGRGSPEALQLRRLLLESRALQAEFMVARLANSLDAIVASAPAGSVEILVSRFCTLADTPAGRYALVDYVNFKGEGIDPGERYSGEGWGLAQVLEDMRGTSPSNADFAEAASRVLKRRVRNAPAGRDEQRWLPGWLGRVETYR